ncbi:MAG TPA: DUF6114 domain-containing protein [Candidatus Acidoferrum sp.]|nr:DUF6114 domain-containing protein [Candidatus Acidoferrum sp.]
MANQPKMKSTFQNKPTAAFILILIGGLIVLIGAALTLATSALLGKLSTGASPFPTNSTNSTIINATASLSSLGSGALSSAAVVTEILGIISLAAGVIMIISSVMLYSTDPKRVRLWSTIALIFSIISLTTLGGFIIGFILGLIGSILGLVHKG